MPVDILKVDRSFVDQLGQDAPGTAIVRAVVELAHQLGLTVTAEGIETARQEDILRSLHCETGQGYLRARPAPAEAITSLLRTEWSRTCVPIPRDPTHGGAWRGPRMGSHGGRHAV